MSEEFSFAPINLGIWDVVHDRYPFKENDTIGILERLALRHKELKKVADVTIVHKSSRETLGKVDEFIWKMWTYKCKADGEDDDDDADEPYRISAKYLEIEISAAALTFLLRFMYTGQYDATMSVGMELLDREKKLSLDSSISKVITANVASKMNLELLKDWWLNPNSSHFILQSNSFMELSVAFIISHIRDIFTFNVITETIDIALPRKLLERLLPNKLQRDLEKYKMFESEKWQFRLKQGPGGNYYYLDMAHDGLAEYLFHWAMMQIRKSRPPTSGDMVSVNDIQNELGDLVKLLNEAEFENFLQHYSDEDGVPVFSTMGSHYFYTLIGSKCRDISYRKNLVAVSFDYEKNQGFNCQSWSEQFDLGYSSTQDDPISSSQSSDPSSSQPRKKRFKYCNVKSSNLLLKQLDKAFDRKEISDVYFQLSSSSKRILTNSFLLSLQSEKFFYYFKCNDSLFHNFYLGRVPLETANDFFKMFYSVSNPPNDTLLDCMKLSTHLEINSFMSRGYISVTTMPISVENVTLQYCMEFNCGDPSKAMKILVPFMKRHLPLILSSEFVGTFESKDLLTHLLSMERTTKLEIGAILAVSRWLRYNFVQKDDPIYERLLDELNFKKLSLGDLHKLLDDGFIKSHHEIVDLSFRLGASSAQN